MVTKVTPKYKTKYGVQNWPPYEASLRLRGDVTVLTLRTVFHLVPQQARGPSRLAGTRCSATNGSSERRSVGSGGAAMVPWRHQHILQAGFQLPRPAG